MSKHNTEVASPSVEPMSQSWALISSPEGGLTLWRSMATTDPESMRETLPAPREVHKVALEPDRPLIIGRQEGGQIEYLDSSYQPTQMAPSGERVVRSNWDEGDLCVSRGHFMLRASVHGILFVNGVPRCGGEIRPPLNGTYLCEPESRRLGDGEEVLIEHGQHICISLPNQTRVVIAAE